MAHAYPLLPFLWLPLTRLEVPGWGRLFRWLKISVPPGSRLWQGAPTRTIRGKSHGLLMELRLSNWAERMTYFLGRYYELPHQLLLQRLLRRGDRVIDVGGNIGMITLLLAKAVGRAGLVQTFEPNPACQHRLRSVLALNGIDWVDVHPYGLSDEAASLQLTVVNDHSGVGTFAPIPSEHESAVTDRVVTQVRRGDDVLQRDPRAIKLIKIDVEGFEARVVSGLRRTLERHRPLVVMEIVDSHLRRAGASAQELVELMQSLGYRAHALGLRRRGLQQELRLRPISGAVSARGATDALFVHPDGPAVDLEPFMVR
jgi:FkbM family methyltransferase